MASLLVGLVILTRNDSPAASTFLVATSTAMDAPASWWTVIVTVWLTPVEVDVRVTVPVLAEPVLASAVMSRVVFVEPSVLSVVIQLSFGVTIKLIVSLVPLL